MVLAIVVFQRLGRDVRRKGALGVRQFRQLVFHDGLLGSVAQFASYESDARAGKRVTIASSNSPMRAAPAAAAAVTSSCFRGTLLVPAAGLATLERPYT